MTISPMQLLHLLWRPRLDHFLRVYVFMTGAAAIGVAWVVGPAAPSMVKNDRNTAITARRHSLSGSAIVAVTLVSVILVGYAVIALKWEAFADYDDSFFTLFALRGRNIAPSIQVSNARFFPLAQQEFNLIRHFTSSAAGYHAVPI